jgi:hypothetical protein
MTDGIIKETGYYFRIKIGVVVTLTKKVIILVTLTNNRNNEIYENNSFTTEDK